MEKKLKYSYDADKRLVSVKGHYRDLLADIQASKDNTKHNNDHIAKYLSNSGYDDYARFAGGTWDDITNLKNMDKFKKQLEDFRKHKLEEKIQKRVDFSVKRVRRTSEHDGDYDLQKRWEIKPFSSAHRSKVPISVVDFKVDFSISAAMSPEDINSYGAMVWSIIQLVETLGIQVNVTIVTEGVGIADNLDNQQEYIIKKSGEYMSPVSLASTFQSTFYRRAIFSGIALCAENQGKHAWDSLGRPKYPNENRNLWYDKGTIYTRPGGQFKIEEVEKCVMEMIGRK